MIDELKDLIAMIANLPSLAIWVVAALLFYKISILASIYATIRFCVGRVVDVYTLPKNVSLDGIVIGEDTYKLVSAQISRLTKGSIRVYGSDVNRLSKAIDLMLENEKK